MSLAVSAAEQKKGGDSLHPIYRAFGTTISVSSSVVLLVVGGST